MNQSPSGPKFGFNSKHTRNFKIVVRWSTMSPVDHLSDQLYLMVINKIVIPKKNETVDRYLKVFCQTLWREINTKKIRIGCNVGYPVTVFISLRPTDPLREFFWKIKGSVGLTLVKTSTMKVYIPLDLFTRSQTFLWHLIRGSLHVSSTLHVWVWQICLFIISLVS